MSVMGLSNTHAIVALLWVCVFWQTSSAFYRGSPPSRFPRLPRCHSESQPCRLKAELVSNDPLTPPSHRLRRVISRPACSCPPSFPCPSDWDSNPNRVVVRELRTNGNINMTFSMMFCTPVRPAHVQCARGDVALRLSGLASVPTEVDAIPCTCADRRPLVLHRRYIGPYFRQYDEYVCANHMRRCNKDWNPDVCLIHTPANQTDLFPCKCPLNTVCRSTSDVVFNKDFRCLNVTF